MIATSILFLIISPLGILATLVPLYWHLEAGNVGTCMYMIWTALMLCIELVGAVVWNGNALDWAPVYCDIIGRIRIAAVIAWPACGLCIVRRLHSIATISNVTTTKAEKRRGMIIDLLITIGIPLFFSLTQLICSGHRYNIYENFNCYPTTWNTPVAFAVVYIWPLIVNLTSVTYGLLTVRAFMKRRKRFQDLVSATGLAWNRYYRLVLLALGDLCIGLPLTIWGIVTPANQVIHPWISWYETHKMYNRTDQYAWVQIQAYKLLRPNLEINRWSPVLCAAVFFAFFGFAEEAKQNYRLFASTITKRLGITTFTQSAAGADSMTSKGGVSFPVFITQQVASKRASLDSFSDKLSIGEYDLKDLPRSSAEQPTTSSSSSVIPPIEEVPQAPQSVPDSAPVRKSSVPDVPKSAYPDNGLDQV